jgi:predicted PurR-regulated permease PerM
LASDLSTTPAAPRRLDVPPVSGGGNSGMKTAAIIVVVIAALYFGREVFVPIALSILLSFALAPPVRWLRRIHVPRILAVISVVALAFAALAAFSMVVAWQVADLAQSLPSYQRNIEAKIDSFRDAPPGGALFDRATSMIRDLGRKIEEQAEDAEAVEETGAPAPAPIPVQVQEPDLGPMELVQTIVGPLVGPLATFGIVIVFVIFMLLKREDLRDRLIRLAGAQDLSRTTDALDDAAHRVGHYLLMQLVVNVTYGLPVAIGLWFIGVPNPLLWGLLATVLRFVPYVGPIISAFFPLALAIAVDPGWETLVWTGGLLIVIELISNNAVEPWLYGASTGLSPVAIIAAAIFWTWLWGPIGLLLSTPLTVCLVVLGQHVPQLAFLDVLFGSEPVLTPVQTLYQRLLGHDPDEATERAEEFLEQHSFVAYLDEVAIPALAMAENDRARGVLDDDRRAVIAASAMEVIDNLAEHDLNRRAPTDVDPKDPATPPETADAALRKPEPDMQIPPDRPIVCAGTRGNLDEVAAAMLGQALEDHGATVRVLPCDALQSSQLGALDLDQSSVMVLSYMNVDSLAHARFLIRRLRRRFPNVCIMLGLWTFTPELMARRDPIAATGADRVATTIADALEQIRDTLVPPRPEAASEPAETPPHPNLSLAAAAS